MIGNLPMVRLLVRRGANVDHPNNKGETALQHAVLHDRVEIVKLLIEGKADPNRADAKGCTPLALARRSGNVEILKLLENDYEPDDEKDAAI